jgi:hypothetical protein
MTRLTKQFSGDKNQVYVKAHSIKELEVDGNTTHLSVFIEHSVNGDGEMVENEELSTLIIEIPTLDVISTFNTTFINRAIYSLKRWLNQIVK